MSVPGVFAPVEVEGKILTDGGTVQNLPPGPGRGALPFADGLRLSAEVGEREIFS